MKAITELDNKDYRKTQKLTWLPVSEKAVSIEIVCVYFDNIISKAVLAKDDDFKDFINKDTKVNMQLFNNYKNRKYIYL